MIRKIGSSFLTFIMLAIAFVLTFIVSTSQKQNNQQIAFSNVEQTQIRTSSLTGAVRIVRNL